MLFRSLTSSSIKKERKLHETIAPARIDDEVSGELQRIAKVIAKAVGLEIGRASCRERV